MLRASVRHPALAKAGEVTDARKVFTDLSPARLRSHDVVGNAVKYISRAGKKDTGKLVEDLKKAGSYVDREIRKLGGTAYADR
jgi:hypothetical protein